MCHIPAKGNVAYGSRGVPSTHLESHVVPAALVSPQAEALKALQGVAVSQTEAHGPAQYLVETHGAGVPQQAAMATTEPERQLPPAVPRGNAGV